MHAIAEYGSRAFEFFYTQAGTCNRKLLTASTVLMREISFGLKTVPSRYCGSRFHYAQCGEEVHWKNNSTALYVLIHGLNSHPVIWDGHIAQLKQDQQIDIFVPFVPHLGNCSLDDAAGPILTHILDYTRQFPANPVFLLGVSNGGRIALELEVRLRTQAAKIAVRVSSIAGSHLGSSRMTILNYYTCRRWYHPEVHEELALNSARARRLIAAVKESFTGTRSYQFFATIQDTHVPDLPSTLPELGKGEERHSREGYGHSSIVGAVREEQIASCEQWRAEQSNDKKRE